MPTDAGTFFAESLLQTVVDKTAELGLPAYGMASYIAGNSIPVMDPCEGLLWVRIDTVMPTDGSGNPFADARIDFDFPAWLYPIQLGFLWCHQNITEDGNFVDPAIEQANAERDGQYRAAIYLALAESYPDAVKPYALGMRLTPWTPFGPDGGYSGGGLLVNVIAPMIVLSN